LIDLVEELTKKVADLEEHFDKRFVKLKWFINFNSEREFR